jgi:hypothetical protein
MESDTDEQHDAIAAEAIITTTINVKYIYNQHMSMRPQINMINIFNIFNTFCSLFSLGVT